MADKQETKGLTPLEEVKLDAEYNYNQRLKEQAEKAKFEAEKAALKQR